MGYVVASNDAHCNGGRPGRDRDGGWHSPNASAEIILPSCGGTAEGVINSQWRFGAARAGEREGAIGTADDSERSCRGDRDGRRPGAGGAIRDVDGDGIAGGLISRRVPGNGLQSMGTVGVGFGVQSQCIRGAGVRRAEVRSVDFKLDAGNFDVIRGGASDGSGAGNSRAIGGSCDRSRRRGDVTRSG